MTTKYTLFDIPTKSDPPVCWSPNTWKARGVLNYKGVPYETEWVEYPDIRVRLAAMGLPATGVLIPYTLPMLQVTITPADGSDSQIKYLTDSIDIAKYINDNHPEPFMDFDHEINEESVKVLNENLMDAFHGLVLCDVPNALPERSAEYFHETRPKWMMMSIAEYKQKKLDEGAWKKLEVGMGKLRKFLAKNGGPFLLGETPSFGDVRVVGFILWAKEGSAPATYEKIKEWGGEELDKFMKAAEAKGITIRATY
ncbi:hypothetical protein ABW20_dc0109175 [Dactylellina cionopaga]|nr:hypothetical protein ABW20_dc0109175 [Dactylellina cionopaga]